VIDVVDHFDASIKRNRADSGPSRSGLASLKPLCSFKIRYRNLWIIALCATACLTATAAAYAQQLSANDFASSATRTANSWWSPQPTAATVVAPHLQLNIAKLSRLEISEPLQPSTTELKSYRPIEDTNNPIENPGVFELSLYTPSTDFNSLAEGESLSPRSFLSLLEAKYVMWESDLAETRSLTSVNKVSVYPLVQIDYGQWHLPISLYTPPLRGSNER
jgi:hypothetical protein